ncbi:MAG: hypothetical protein IIA41_03940 [SAR324 cluster bacterium]|nr:hypothetical protein [SAR324 cluster bacterium]
MFTPTTYTAWLDGRAGEIFEKITHQQTISNEETLVLILKAQNDQLHMLSESMDRRFEQVDKRFEQVDKRFDQIERRLEQMDQRFEQLSNNFKWGVIATIGFISLLMTVLKFFP